jgi:hypothetical protein
VGCYIIGLRSLRDRYTRYDNKANFALWLSSGTSDKDPFFYHHSRDRGAHDRSHCHVQEGEKHELKHERSSKDSTIVKRSRSRGFQIGTCRPRTNAILEEQFCSSRSLEHRTPAWDTRIHAYIQQAPREITYVLHS